MNETPPREPAFYTIPQLAERWQVSRTTVFNEIRRGRLKRKLIGGQVRFSAEEVSPLSRHTVPGDQR
jgi:excisionase family DNA binding protein